MKPGVAFAAAAILVSSSVVGAAPITQGGMARSDEVPAAAEVAHLEDAQLDGNYVTDSVIAFAKGTTADTSFLEAREIPNFPRLKKLTEVKSFPIDPDAEAIPEQLRRVDSPDAWADAKRWGNFKKFQFTHYHTRKPGLRTTQEQHIYMRKLLLDGAPGAREGQKRYKELYPSKTAKFLKKRVDALRKHFGMRSPVNQNDVAVNNAHGGANHVQGDVPQVAEGVPPV